MLLCRFQMLVRLQQQHNTTYVVTVYASLATWPVSDLEIFLVILYLQLIYSR